MYTNNYYAARKSIFVGYGTTGYTAVDYSGTTRNLYNYDVGSGTQDGNMCSVVFPMADSSGVSPANNTKLSTSTRGIRFGTGRTPPSLNDYTLSGELVTNISILSQTQSHDITDDGATVNMKYIIENTSDTEITIGEMGLFHVLKYNNTANKSSFLIDRQVFPEPIVIPPGSTVEIRYSLDYTF